MMGCPYKHVTKKTNLGRMTDEIYWQFKDCEIIGDEGLLDKIKEADDIRCLEPMNEETAESIRQGALDDFYDAVGISNSKGRTILFCFNFNHVKHSANCNICYGR